MRVLVLARHAKAEVPSVDRFDFERGLAPRGEKDARALGVALSQAGLEPDVALVSDAIRTAQTWDIASGAWDVPEVDMRRDLYGASVGAVLGVLQGVPAGATTVMIVGHEPAMSGTAVYLAGPGSHRTSLGDVSGGLRTGTAAILEFDGEWADAAQGSARLRAVVGRDD